MKFFLSLFTLCFALIFTCRAEIFIGSNNQVNSVTIATNEAIIISAMRETGDGGGWPTLVGSISINGSAHNIAFDLYQNQQTAIAGPATLTFPANPPTNSLPVVIAFQRLEGNSIQSVYVATNNSAAINVPYGKTCHLFAPVCANNSGISTLGLSVQTTNGFASNLDFFGGEEYTGSASLIITNDPNNYGYGIYRAGAIVTYYFNENALVLPGSGLLAGPTGRFEIIVEKSTNLTNWVPVVVNGTSTDQQAFYRLKISQ